jgi:hypothetical protein
MPAGAFRIQTATAHADPMNATGIEIANRITGTVDILTPQR